MLTLIRAGTLIDGTGKPPLPAWLPRPLGLRDKIGNWEAGKRADLVAVTGNPLDDIRVLRRGDVVMREGRIVARDGRILSPL